MENNLDDWQTRCEKSRERLSHLLLTKIWTDCTFLVGSEDPEIITAHKFVLAMSSPVFETMFYGSIPEGKGPIKVPDVQPEAFKMLLRFLYTDDCNIRSYQEASELYFAARKYMVPFIQQRCASYMTWSLTPQNACFAYEFANLFDEKSLLKAALKTIKRKTKEVLKDSSFNAASINTVAAVFSQQELDIDSELDLFRAADKYAESLGLKNIKRSFEDAFESHKKSRIESKRPRNENDKAETNNDEQTIKLELVQQKDDEQVQSEEIIKHVRKAISHIRFLTLTPQQFASVADSALLTEDEALVIMLSVVGIDMPTPAGFSGSRERRGLRHWSPDCSAAPSSQTQSNAAKESIIQNPEEPHVAVCMFTVANFKNRKRPVSSDQFYTDTFEWRVRVIPGTVRSPDGLQQKTFGVYVDCSGPDLARGWGCNAHVTIELEARIGPGLKQSFSHLYNSNSKESGYRNWMLWDNVCDSEAGLLRSNTLRMNVQVAATATKP